MKPLHEIVGAGSRSFVALMLVLLGCSRRADDCNYTLTCPIPDAGNSGGSATGGIGTGGSHSGGGSSLGGSNAGGSNAGASSSGGNGTGGITSVCNTVCSGTKPVCNESAKTCVECTADGNCTGAKPACNLTTNSCVQCTKDGNCSGTTPVCDTTASVCVQCTKDANCPGTTPACNTATDTDAGTVSGMNTCVQCTKKEHCSGTAPLCDTAKNACVECLAASDCTDASVSACVNGKCEPCSSNADCSHISGKGVCKTGSASDGDAGVDASADGGVSTSECVQCTGTQYAACGQSAGKNLVCNSLTNACSTFAEHSGGLCKTCVSDAQCPLGEMCVEETFNGQSVGYFCFYKQGDTPNGAPTSCINNGRPYSGVLKNAISIDGQTADICSLVTTTCTALNEYRSKDCTSPTGTANEDACGFAPGVDSKCAETSTAGAYLCTTTCLSDLDCLTGSGCDTGANPRLCTFQ